MRKCQQTLDDPEHVNTQIGHPAAIQSTKVNIGESLNLTAAVNSSGILHNVQDYLLWTAQLVRSTGAILSIDLFFPTASLSDVAAGQFAQKCTELNAMNVSVMVTIGPEMNANWHPYGQRPATFVKLFRTLATAIRRVTNGTALVWAPVSVCLYF